MPFSNAFGWPHLIVILAVVLLLFGATKLPALSKSIGQSIKIFRKEIKTDDKPASSTDTVVTDGSADDVTATSTPATPRTTPQRDAGSDTP